MAQLQVAAEIERLFARHPSPIGRDLKVTLRRLLLGGNLAPEAAAAVLLALGCAVREPAIAELAERWMASLGFEPAQITEAREAPALFGMVNTYYSFRDVLGGPDYEPAGLTMTATARPALGKPAFERLALALSVLNKCATCIRYHESKLRELGSSSAEIHDLARLAAVIKGCGELPQPQGP